MLQFDLTADDQALFLAEADELLQRMEEALVELERAPEQAQLVHEIFRTAHTIKGSSATIGHSRMAVLTHAIETRLDEVRKGAAPVTPELIEALLGALDILKLLRDEVDTLAPLVRDAMEHALPLDVPLTVDIKTGRDWESLTPMPDPALAGIA